MSESALSASDIKNTILTVAKNAFVVHSYAVNAKETAPDVLTESCSDLLRSAVVLRSLLRQFVEEKSKIISRDDDSGEILDIIDDLSSTLSGHVKSLVELTRELPTLVDDAHSSKVALAKSTIEMLSQTTRNLIRGVDVFFKTADISEESDGEDSAPLQKSIPVTVITGFLGSGKTTLLNYILTQNHGKRIAVIENEFGEIGIDDALIKDKFDSKEEIFEMNNGCICCTVRGDLIRILGKLLKQRDRFDYILIETTGLADPAPIAQTFFTVPEIGNQLRLDSILTVVDTKHILQHLDETKPDGVENESVEQLAFADRVLLNKIDLVTSNEIDIVSKRIRTINSTCEIIPTQNSVVDLDRILDLRAFDLDKIMTMDPAFLQDQEHQHDSTVFSVGIVEEGQADIEKLNAWIGKILRELGNDIFRMKGVIAVKGQNRRFVFQGVHMLFGGSPQQLWEKDEKRVSKMVFIGRNLDRKLLVDGFRACLAK